MDLPQFNEFIDWLEINREIFEDVISGTISRMYREKGEDFDAMYQCVTSMRQAFLGNSSDINYTLENIDLAYTSWYLLRRVADGLPIIDNILKNHKEGEIIISDLGAGSGAFALSIILYLAFLKEKNIEAPRIEYRAIEISNQFTEIRDRLIGCVSSLFGISISIQSQLTDWRMLQISSTSRKVVVANYLIQGTETTDRDVVPEFSRIFNTNRIDDIYMTTSPGKSWFFDRLRQYCTDSRNCFEPGELDNFRHEQTPYNTSFKLTELRQGWTRNHLEDENYQENISLFIRDVSWKARDNELTSYMHLRRR